MDKQLGAIVLAAGKGKRMNATDANKVTLLLGKKPMIVHTVDFLEKIQASPIIIVVGFAKQSVIDALHGRFVLFAQQKKRLGTGHALLQGMTLLPKEVKDIIVVNGDDSAFYSESMIKNLILLHFSSGASITLLTVVVDDSSGLGRVVRDLHGNLASIVEEKDATEKEKMTKEINPGCYMFTVDFLKRNIKRIAKNSKTGEYYISDLIKLAKEDGQKVEVLQAGKLLWRGINTNDELIKANKLFSQV